MHQPLITYCSQFVKLSEEDREAIRKYFRPLDLKRRQYLLQEGSICDFIAFVSTGVIRHFHVKDGNEITCDITLAGSFITDFRSFTRSIPSAYNFQALKDTSLLVVGRKDLLMLYEQSKTIETLGRIMAELVAQKTTETAMSLASDKPEERLDKLISGRPELFREVPQRYLASLLGITPESLSRIRARKLKSGKS